MGRPRAATAIADTANQMLNVAERLIQTRGFNGFSYADIAAKLGVRKASLHYHFATKALLGVALIERYTTQFQAALDAIAKETADSFESLRRYVALYADVLRGGRMCLCGMLAAEYSTLPPPMQSGIRGFFDLSERWLTVILERGRGAGQLAFAGTAVEAAQSLVGALEGSMLLARPYGEVARFTVAAERLLAGLGPRTVSPH